MLLHKSPLQSAFTALSEVTIQPDPDWEAVRASHEPCFSLHAHSVEWRRHYLARPCLPAGLACLPRL